MFSSVVEIRLVDVLICIELSTLLVVNFDDLTT